MALAEVELVAVEAVVEVVFVVCFVVCLLLAKVAEVA